jgi:tetratricopeptide (TPR) repeat protein
MQRERPARFAPVLAAALLVLVAAGPLATPQGTAAAAVPPNPSAADLREQALDLAYNLDHDRAIELLRRAVALSPDDPAPHRSLASVLWLNMLFQRGAVTVDHYLGSLSRPNVELARPPAELDAEFRQHVDRAIVLSRARVRASPRNAQAHYDLGSALGLQASYMATVEGRLLAGFRAARQSFDEHEQVLQLDPRFTDAGLIVGTYRYVVSTFSLPMRVMAYVVGFGGGRERGIELLEATAARGHDARTDAMFALILVYNRERRYGDALRILDGLRRMYPRNRLIVLEQGATALRGGRADDAEHLMTEGLGMFAKDARAKIPGEEALWRYKRGAARASLGRTGPAIEDLRRATAADAQQWVQGRARVELARIALGRGDRPGAAAEAQQAETLCRNGNDPFCADRARELLRSANGR